MTLMQAVLKAEGDREGYKLVKGTYEIGRSENQNMPVITGPGFEQGRTIGKPDRTISRKHLAIEVLEDKLKLIDEGSRNRSYLDGKIFEQVEISAPRTYNLKLGYTFSLELVVG